MFVSRPTIISCWTRQTLKNSHDVSHESQATERIFDGGATAVPVMDILQDIDAQGTLKCSSKVSDKASRR